MSVFRRRREEGPEPSTTAPAATVPVARDPELGVPPFRPAQKDAPSVSAAPRPSAPPASPVLAARSPSPTPTLAGARSVGAAAVPLGTSPRSEGAERRTLVVGKGISLQGTVSDAERLVVEGTVESQMIQAAELLITHSGVCKGELQVEDAEIAGVFDGTLTATGNLIIRATGKVLGQARCRKLQVEEGGQITGRMEMLSDAALTAVARGPVGPTTPPTGVSARSPEHASA